MGGNQSVSLQEATSESVMRAVSKILNQTDVSQKVDIRSNTEIHNKIFGFLKNCTVNNDINQVVKLDIKTISAKSANNKIDNDFISKISEALKASVEQKNKELNFFQYNKSDIDEIMTTIDKKEFLNDVKNIFSSKIEITYSTSRKIFNVAYNCEDSTINNIINSTVGITSKLISNEILSNDIISKGITDMEQKAEATIKQKNTGFDLTMVAIVAIIAFLIYIMAESGTLGQLMPGGGGGKSSRGGVSSVVRNPVTSRSSLLAQVEKRMNSVFGAVGKQKAWWVGL
jgi:hypothetical protein